jgi:GH18 family chitinase
VTDVFQKHIQQDVKLSAVFPKFSLLMVTSQYYPVFVTGGFRRFNELRKRNPELKTLAALGGWNEGSISYSSVSHFQCVYIKVRFSRWYTGKAKCYVVPVNIHEGICWMEV